MVHGALFKQLQHTWSWLTGVGGEAAFPGHLVPLGCSRAQALGKWVGDAVTPLPCCAWGHGERHLHLVLNVLLAGGVAPFLNFSVWTWDRLPVFNKLFVYLKMLGTPCAKELLVSTAWWCGFESLLLLW